MRDRGVNAFEGSKYIHLRRSRDVETKVLVGPFLLSAANSNWLFWLGGGVYMHTSMSCLTPHMLAQAHCMLETLSRVSCSRDSKREKTVYQQF